MIALLVARGLSKPLAMLVTYGGALILIVAAIWWLRNDAYRDGEKASDARWGEASRRMEAAMHRARAAADTLAAARERQTAIDIKELRDAADKGDDTRAGPGVTGVLDRLRTQQGR